MKHGPELSFDDDGRPVLITRAALPYEEEHRARVRKYLTLMFWRIPALILAAVAYGIWQNGLDLAHDHPGIGAAAVDGRADRQRPPAAACRGAAALRRQPAEYRSFRRPNGPLWSAAHSLRRNRTTAIRRVMFPAEDVLSLFSGESQVDSRITADQKV